MPSFHLPSDIFTCPCVPKDLIMRIYSHVLHALELLWLCIHHHMPSIHTLGLPRHSRFSIHHVKLDIKAVAPSSQKHNDKHLVLVLLALHWATEEGETTLKNGVVFFWYLLVSLVFEYLIRFLQVNLISIINVVICHLLLFSPSVWHQKQRRKGSQRESST